eukprot:2676823-Prymnesium_polylepis.1
MLPCFARRRLGPAVVGVIHCILDDEGAHLSVERQHLVNAEGRHQAAGASHGTVDYVCARQRAQKGGVAGASRCALAGADRTTKHADREVDVKPLEIRRKFAERGELQVVRRPYKAAGVRGGRDSAGEHGGEHILALPTYVVSTNKHDCARGGKHERLV